MEFGVHTGNTITVTAKWRTQYCGSSSPPVFGFDTFTGVWRSPLMQGWAIGATHPRWSIGWQLLALLPNPIKVALTACLHSCVYGTHVPLLRRPSRAVVGRVAASAPRQQYQKLTTTLTLTLNPHAELSCSNMSREALELMTGPHA